MTRGLLQEGQRRASEKAAKQSRHKLGIIFSLSVWWPRLKPLCDAWNVGIFDGWRELYVPFTHKNPPLRQAGGGNEPQEDGVRRGVSPNVNLPPGSVFTEELFPLSDYILLSVVEEPQFVAPHKGGFG